MSDPENEQSTEQEAQQAAPSPADDAQPVDESGAPAHGWELWTQVSVLMAAFAVVGWGIVWLRLGTLSIYTHAFGLSALGFLTLPVIFWGLVKSMFNRPVLRRPRVIAFVLLLGVSFFCSQPRFAVPLSTEGWTSAHRYRLPFQGAWVTTAGGDSTRTNYHAMTATYRWGYDFTPLVDGARHRGAGDKLEDYACFGQPVLAPVAGKVHELENEHPDNAPQTFDEESVLGNYVVLRVDEGEYLYVAHLKQHSIALQAGQTVQAGDKLGECGNSGRAWVPHVHVHLQNSAEFPVAESLPLKFSNYLANGEPVQLGMPLGSTNPEKPLGQQVENQPAP